MEDLPADDAVTRATTLLTLVSEGDAHAAESLAPMLYDRLRQLAGTMLASERAGHTLQPTALVHEAYVKLIDQRAVTEDDQAAFMGLAATVMRRVLVDHARARNRLKRGGDRRRVALEEPAQPEPSAEDNGLDVEALDAALERLAALDERKARLVELRFFCGLEEAAAAELVGISRATASREWRMARAWLMREIEQAADG